MYRSVLGCWLEVLADSQEVDVSGAQIVHDLENLLPRLAQADHDAGLGEDRGGQVLDSG